MPRMTQEELEESIQWEAEQYIPFDVKDVNIDTQILNPDANDATGQMDVLLVAAKKDMINDYTTVVSEAGLLPVGRRRRRLRGPEHVLAQLRRARERDGRADQRRRLGGEHQHHLATA